jgi:hypothetical protein
VNAGRIRNAMDDSNTVEARAGDHFLGHIVEIRGYMRAELAERFG